MASAIGLVQVASPDEVMARQEEEEGGEQVEIPDPLQFADGVARYVRACWDEAFRYKRSYYEQRFTEAQYAREGRYTPRKLQQIQQTGGSTEYARIVANKARILESWLTDIFMAQGERPWSIEATPSPNLSPEVEEDVQRQVSMWVAQMASQGQNPTPTEIQRILDEQLDAERTRIKDVAETRAKRMEEVIADQLADGGFNTAFREFIAHFTTYPGAILKGPVFRQQDRLHWSEVDGTYIPEVTEEIVMEFEAVHPMNAYPAPGATEPQEGYFVEHMTLTGQDLYALIGVDGFDEVRIRRVLDRCQNGGYRWLDTSAGQDGDESNSPEVRVNNGTSGFIDVLEFHGPIPGRDLAEWGVEGVDDDPHEYYEATVWLIDTEVIKATLNDDPMGRRPYYKACYEPVPGQFWGHSLYDALADVQGVGNAAVRSLVNNMAIASGPQATVNIDRLPAGEDVTNLYPWKIWQVHDSQFSNSANPAVDFFQPQANVNELMQVLDKFYALADDFSMIPRYMSGSDQVSGPGRTASGLSMLLDAANKGLKSIVQTIDQNVMTQLLRQLYDHNMVYAEDDSIKGDSQVVARGVASLMQLETLRMRRNEFLQITANPQDSNIVGPEGRAAILREIAKTLGMDVNKVVPPDAGQRAQQQQQEQMQAEMMAEGAGGANSPQQSQEQLGDGSPVMDVASPSSMV